MSARWVWQAHLRGGGTLCVVALLSLSGDACFRRVDVSKLHCLDNSGCPSDHYCTNGHCVAGQSPVDGSNADLTPSSGLDGQSGFDGMQSSGGAGGSALDGGLGGAGGGMVDSSGGGGASGGAPKGAATYTPASLEAEKVYYWRVDEFDAVETHKGDVWGFTTPGAAASLQPVNGAVDVQISSMLNWIPAASAG